MMVYVNQSSTDLASMRDICISCSQIVSVLFLSLTRDIPDP